MSQPMVTSGNPIALDGSIAQPGTLGRWLDEADVLSSNIGASVESTIADNSLRFDFPRNWPAAFKNSAALKGLVNRELKGSRCRAITSLPSGPDAAAGHAAPVQLHPLHSFANAAQLIAALPGWRVVKGFVVLERVDRPAGEAFVAIRHWWNESPSGSWLDFMPLVPASAEGKLLLVESPLGEKKEAPLRAAQQVFGMSLARALCARGPNSGHGIEAGAGSNGNVDRSDPSAPTDVSEAEGMPQPQQPPPPPQQPPPQPPQPPPARPRADDESSHALHDDDLGQVRRQQARRRPPSAAVVTSDPQSDIDEQQLRAEIARRATRSFPKRTFGEDNGDPAHGPEPPPEAHTVDDAAADDCGDGGGQQLVEQLVDQDAGGGGGPPDEPAGNARADGAIDARAGSADGRRADADSLFRRGDEVGAAKLYAEIAAPSVEAAGAAKEDGNEAFKSDRLIEAVACYEAGLKHLGLQVGKFNYHADQAAAEYGRVLRQLTPAGLVFALHSNRAASLLRLERFEEAEGAAGSALKERPHDLKARVRRAKAARQLGKPAAAAVDLAEALKLSPSSADIAKQLVDVWVERAPLIEPFVSDVRAAALKIDGKGGGNAEATRAAERALCRGLHAMCQPGEWCREGALGAAAIGSRKAPGGVLKQGNGGGGGGGGVTKVVDGPRLLARKSIGALLPAAVQLLKKPTAMETDVDGARCLLRLCGWVVGIKNAMETEEAILSAMHTDIRSDWSVDHTTTLTEALIGPEACCMAMLQLMEALARRRVSNLAKMHHPMDVLVRVFSFRASAKVRMCAVSVLAWCARCPKTKSFLFDGRYDERTLKPVNNAIKDYARHLGLDEWFVDESSAEYSEETGICLGDGSSRDVGLPPSSTSTSG